MSELFAREEAVLADALAFSARGPKRNGIYALWLFVRLCGDLGPPKPVAERSHRRRVQQFERRISTLTLPAEFRRAIGTGAGCLRESEPDATRALRILLAPSRQTLGHRVGEAVADAIRRARDTYANDSQPTAVGRSPRLTSRDNVSRPFQGTLNPRRPADG